MRYLKYSLSFLIIILALQANAQILISEINTNKISHKKVLHYLQNQQTNHINSILDIRPSLSPDSDNSGFRIDERIYIVKGSLDKVWQHYVKTNPGDSWNGKKVSFALLLSKKEKRVVYEGESVSRIDTGQIVYLNIKLLSGFANLATVFEFTSVDEENKTLEFSYINGNATEGTQNLKFSETAKGYTEIIHTTHFKSNLAIRDRVYPFFHARIINDFHRNMKRLYLAKNINAIETKSFAVNSNTSNTSIKNPPVLTSE